MPGTGGTNPSYRKYKWNPMATAVRLRKPRMRALWLSAVLIALPLVGCGGAPDENESNLQEVNVNSRYIIESVHVMGLRSVRISKPLRAEIDQVVGAKLDHPELEKLAD